MNALYGVNLDSDVHIEMDSTNEEKEDKEKEDKEEEDEDEKDEDEDEDEDDGKERWTIGQGEIVNSSADNVDTMVDNDPIVLPA